ncbi:MAG: TatD family hydrolase [Candidatus Paceibacterota bacterium]|jgi:TatD DNase family protein
MTPKFFDAHTHLNMLNIAPWGSEPGWEEVGKKTLEQGTWLVNVGADEKSSRLAVEQAHKLGEGCFATVGIHPTEGEGSDFAVIAELAKDEKVVAIGECGLEYFKIDNEDIRSQQCELFIKHIELALEVGKPLMIHCRANADGDAYQDTLEILRSYEGKVRFNMHFYTGDWATAQEFLALGGYLSFPGVITFTKQYDEVVKKAPLDRIMSETDAPFATPVPHRGERNEPVYVHYVAEHLAKLRPEPKEEVLGALVQNALNFFDISAKS